MKVTVKRYFGQVLMCKFHLKVKIHGYVNGIEQVNSLRLIPYSYLTVGILAYLHNPLYWI